MSPDSCERCHDSVDVSESIATLTIDRPAVKNALDLATVNEIRAALDELWRPNADVGVLDHHRRGRGGVRLGRRHQRHPRARARRRAGGDQLVAVRRGRKLPAADHRRDQRLRARRRLRAGAGVRHPRRVRHREVRPAGARARDHPRRRRDAAAAADRRHGAGQAPGPDRRDHRREAGAGDRPR